MMGEGTKKKKKDLLEKVKDSAEKTVPVRPFFEKDREIFDLLQQENTNRLRILLLFPIAVSIVIIFLNLQGIVVFPWQAPLPVLLAGTVPYILLYSLLWIPKTAHTYWLHILIIGIWVISMFIDPFTSQSDIVVFEFFINLLLINLFIFIPPMVILLINAGAFLAMSLNLEQFLVLSTLSNTPLLTLVFASFFAIVFIALTVMSIHEFQDAALRIRREREMEKQKDELLRLNKMRDDVDRIVRHDLKNPLNGILGVAQLLRMEPELPETVKEYTPVLEQSGYTMLHMINNSLDLFKMEEGTYEVKAAPLDCRELLKSILAEFESSKKQKGLEIRLNQEPVDAIQPVMGEKDKVHSMFSNLIKNAVEASPENETVTITIAPKNMKNTGKEPERGYLSVDIHNMGTVPEDIRSRFFERYATSGKQHGTGLGTYSAALIARSHGGSIDFTTSEEEGTHVTVDLPLFRLR